MIKVEKLINQAYKKDISYILEFTIKNSKIEDYSYDIFNYSLDENNSILIDSIEYNYLSDPVCNLDDLDYINGILDTSKYSRNKVVINDLLPIKTIVGELIYKFNKVYNSDLIKIWKYDSNELTLIKEMPIEFYYSKSEYENSIRNFEHMNVRFLNSYRITPKLKTDARYIKILNLIFEL